MLLDIDFPVWTPWFPWAVFGFFILLMAGRVCFLLGRRHAVCRVLPEPTSPPLAKQPLHDPFVHGSLSDQRQACRRQGNHVPVLISDAEAKASPTRGVVIDRSMTGLRLALDEPVTAGTILSVRPVQEGGLIPWVQLQVKVCQKADLGWEIGCQFVKVPPTSVLWSFG